MSLVLNWRLGDPDPRRIVFAILTADSGKALHQRP